MRTILTVLTLVAIGLSGCTSDDPGPQVVDNVTPEDFVLEAGKGAIAGLLLDDRFRPIELTDDPKTEFQARGFILLQETGQQAKSTENGEFTFVDLEPGTYTLRATIEGHEATPAKVEVEEAVFAESSLQARRVVSTEGLLISYEYAAFSSCGVNAVIIGTPLDCTADLSGDTDRAGFTVDYTGYDARHFIMEMRANNPNYFDVWARPNGQSSVSQAYQILGGPETQYLRWQLNLNETAMHDVGASGEGEEGVVWDNAVPVQTVLYLNSLGFEQGVGFGAGVYLGVQANFLQSVFVEHTPEDVDTFCVICSA